MVFDATHTIITPGSTCLKPTRKKNNNSDELQERGDHPPKNNNNEALSKVTLPPVRFDNNGVRSMNPPVKNNKPEHTRVDMS